MVQEVAAASTEQAAGVSQINRALLSVDQVTQRNASASEELASTAEEMAAQAESLQQLVSFFQVSATGERRPPRRALPLLSRPSVPSRWRRMGAMATGVSSRRRAPTTSPASRPEGT